MPLIPADLARTLAVSLDGRTLGSWVLGPGTSDDEVLVELGEHLLDGVARAVGPDEPLDPGPLDEPEPEPESAEDPPAAAQPIESPHVVSTPAPAPPIAESAENGILRDAATSPEMSAKPPVTDTSPPAVAVSGTAEPQHVGEAARGQATDAAVRGWARKHDVPCSTTGALKAWVRAEYERLGGDPPDFRARRMAREVGGATPTTPPVHPDVATHDTVNVWLVRNGFEDRLPPSEAGRSAYRAAWPEPAPPAAPPAAAGQDTAGPDTSAADWSSAGRDPAVAEGAETTTVGEADRGRPTDTAIRRWNTQHQLTPLPANRRPPTWLREQHDRLQGGEPDEAARNVAAYHEPQPAPAPAEDEGPQVMAERMLRNRSTPKAVADATGLDIAEVRDLEAAMRKTKGRGR